MAEKKEKVWMMKVCKKCSGNNLIGNWCSDCEIDVTNAHRIVKVKEV